MGDIYTYTTTNPSLFQEYPILYKFFICIEEYHILHQHNRENLQILCREKNWEISSIIKKHFKKKFEAKNEANCGKFKAFDLKILVFLYFHFIQLSI